jgi:hypothetical protein
MNTDRRKEIGVSPCDPWNLSPISVFWKKGTLFGVGWIAGFDVALLDFLVLLLNSLDTDKYG